MILNPAELKLIGPSLALLETNSDIHVKVEISVLDRKVRFEANSSGIVIHEQVGTEASIMEFYAKPMGLAIAYRMRRLEDLLYSNN